MPYMVWKWVCTECCNMNGSELYALPQSHTHFKQLTGEDEESSFLTPSVKTKYG